MRRLPLLLALVCAGSAGVLLLGRQLLELRPALTPRTPTAALGRSWRLDPDPLRRREAALLLLQRSGGRGESDPQRQRLLLRHQGWGRDPLAALVLKRDAQAAERLGEQAGAERLWSQLLRRFPEDPASADALYALGRNRPPLRRELLERFPAHPAALAAAVEAGSGGALHLARWGERWPGAAGVMRERCLSNRPALTADERDRLAGSLARLGELKEAQACLGARSGSSSTELALARDLLRDPSQEAAAEARLVGLARRHPTSPEALEAVRLLGEGRSASSLAALAQLPASLQATAPAQARRALASDDPRASLAVLRRWPGDPASWSLQWEQARRAALRGAWDQVLLLLGEPSLAGALPPVLEARRLFWLGLAEWELGRRSDARRRWEQLLQVHPGGYYGWRAAVRLGQAGESSRDGGPAAAHAGLAATAEASWHPLESGERSIDRLWRLGQPLEAWEHWRVHKGGSNALSPQQLLVEGRLRRGVGDHWIGLGQLELASLRLPPDQCRLARVLERELHTPAYAQELEEASRQEGVHASLLAAVAKQESRFSPSVRSPVGAVGLLQLMPATAAEVAGEPLSGSQLEEPSRNATLGARYLGQLLARWQGDPLLAVASYNAGPGAVAGWLDARLQQQPELWVEAIPYPETRLYVKKVLGNRWSMGAARPPGCREFSAPAVSPPQPR